MLTFQPELAARVYNWFNLIPKGSRPDHVRRMLSTLDCAPGEVVLDPFAGEGTTLVECQLAGVDSLGFEINPFLHFVSQSLTCWNLSPETALEALEQILCRHSQLRDGTDFEDLPRLGLKLPPIDKPLSWWRPDVLTDLLLLKHTIETLCPDTHLKRFFLLALAGVLVPELTNVRVENNQLYLINRDADDILAVRSFAAHARSMIGDLPALQKFATVPESHSLLQDATELTDLSTERAINCVVTSPPYPDRYSFVWNTMPHLYFFDFLGSARDASTLDQDAVGGTWGAATFKLLREDVSPACPAVANAVGPLAESIRAFDRLGANHLTKYFNSLATHITALEHLPQKDMRIAYMIGTTKIGDVLVPTDEILTNIIEGLGLGYKVRSIEKCGPYLGNPDIQESVVYAWKG